MKHRSKLFNTNYYHLLLYSHCSDIQERSKQTVSAEEAQVRWGAGGTPDHFLWLWWHQPFSMESSAGAAASRQLTGGDLINLPRRPAPPWDALLTQCRWWERAGWRSPNPCWSLSQHWAAPSATDWYTLSVKERYRRSFLPCCWLTIQPALLPIAYRPHSGQFP